MLDLFTYAFLFAAFAIVFCEVLTDTGMILAWYIKLIDRLPEWLNKPLGNCIYCFGGQVALWGYLIKNDYKLVEHILFITLTIFFIHIFKLWK